ncbi:MAG TPA: ComF family protein [Candidatus Binataceae bacterium]|nr:ComF family protein [Candidatus Binataceae bacterium]
MAMLNALLNFVYPPNCPACGIRLPIETERCICAACIAKIERIVEPFCSICGEPLRPASMDESGQCLRCRASARRFRSARSAARYDPSSEVAPGALGVIIRRHKYGLDQSLTRAMAECLGATLPYVRGEHDLVVPVPLHRARLRWRGFNQAALLGIEVARRLGCAFDAGCLERVRATPPQTARDHGARRRNVRRAFRAIDRGRLRGHRVLLVDDVMTTGATADECAEVLLAAGARTVDVFTLARAL